MLIFLAHVDMYFHMTQVTNTIRGVILRAADDFLLFIILIF